LRPVRVWFSKLDSAKFISHLDLNRLFIRAFNRSGLDIWFTEGFNPHPFITFALPLSLGQESVCEIMDFRMNDSTPLENIQEILNSVLPPDIRIVFIAEPVLKAKEIGFSKYEIIIDSEQNIEERRDMIKNILLSDEQMNVLKRTKSKEFMIDVKEKLSLSEDDILISENRMILKPVLVTGAEDNINPSLLVSGLSEALNEEFYGIRIVRISIFNKKMGDFK